MACSSSSGGISWWFEFSLQASIIPTGDDTDLTITMFVSPPGTQLTKQLTLKSTGTGEVGFDVEHENPFTFDISPGVRDIRVFGLQASDTINGTEIQAILGSSQQSGPICQTLKLSVFKAVIKEFDVIINEATLDEAIGNKVSLLGTTQPPGISIDSVDWIVEGPTIKGIERTAAAGRNVPLEEADLTNPNLGFYWVTGRQTYRVSLDITVGQTVRSAFANFRVAAPNPLLSLQGGIVQVNELNWGKPDPQYALHCGNTLGPDANASGLYGKVLNPNDPPIFPGQISWIQIMWGERESRVPDGPWQPFPVPEGRDQAMPFPYIDILIQDSPGTPLHVPPFAPYDGYMRNDHFRTYLMWRPLGSNTVPIAVACIVWDWKGRVTRVDLSSGDWTFSESPENPLPTEFPPDLWNAQTEPRWTRETL